MERGDETASAFASSLTSSPRLGPETRKAGQMWEKEAGSRKQESAPYNPHFGGRPGMERGETLSWRKRKYSNQVSWHNPSFKTPRMEELSLDGVRLSKSYVSPKCSPSRAALMTGLYPWRLGLHHHHHHHIVEVGSPARRHRTIPGNWSRSKQGSSAGAATERRLRYASGAKVKCDFFNQIRQVGKWHLGYCKETYLPMNRGFQSFFGQYNHVTNYYTR